MKQKRSSTAKNGSDEFYKNNASPHGRFHRAPAIAAYTWQSTLTTPAVTVTGIDARRPPVKRYFRESASTLCRPRTRPAAWCFSSTALSLRSPGRTGSDRARSVVCVGLKTNGYVSKTNFSTRTVHEKINLIVLIFPINFTPERNPNVSVRVLVQGNRSGTYG